MILIYFLVYRVDCCFNKSKERVNKLKRNGTFKLALRTQKRDYRKKTKKLAWTICNSNAKDRKFEIGYCDM